MASGRPPGVPEMAGEAGTLGSVESDPSMTSSQSVRRREPEMQQVWPPHVEEAFREALEMYPADDPRRNLPCRVKPDGNLYGRNLLIARYIKFKTGVERSRKQVSSHLQVLLKKRASESAASSGTVQGDRDDEAATAVVAEDDAVSRPGVRYRRDYEPGEYDVRPASPHKRPRHAPGVSSWGGNGGRGEGYSSIAMPPGYPESRQALPPVPDMVHPQYSVGVPHQPPHAQHQHQRPHHHRRSVAYPPHPQHQPLPPYHPGYEYHGGSEHRYQPLAMSGPRHSAYESSSATSQPPYRRAQGSTLPPPPSSYETLPSRSGYHPAHAQQRFPPPPPPQVQAPAPAYSPVYRSYHVPRYATASVVPPPAPSQSHSDADSSHGVHKPISLYPLLVQASYDRSDFCEAYEPREHVFGRFGLQSFQPRSMLPISQFLTPFPDLSRVWPSDKVYLVHVPVVPMAGPQGPISQAASRMQLHFEFVGSPPASSPLHLHCSVLRQGHVVSRTDTELPYDSHSVSAVHPASAKYLLGVPMCAELVNYLQLLHQSPRDQQAVMLGDLRMLITIEDTSSVVMLCIALQFSLADAEFVTARTYRLVDQSEIDSVMHGGMGPGASATPSVQSHRDAVSGMPSDARSSLYPPDEASAPTENPDNTRRPAPASTSSSQPAPRQQQQAPPPSYQPQHQQPHQDAAEQAQAQAQEDNAVTLASMPDPTTLWVDPGASPGKPDERTPQHRSSVTPGYPDSDPFLA